MINEIFSNEFPWAGINFLAEIEDKVKNGQRPPMNFDEKKYRCAKDIKNLIQGCWDGIPENRFPIGIVAQRLEAMIENFASTEETEVQPSAQAQCILSEITNILRNPVSKG